MAEIRNPETLSALRRVIHLQSAVDHIPYAVSNNVQLVAEINPALVRRVDFVKSTGQTNTTGGTIMTTASGVDTYLTGCFLAVNKDVSSASTDSSIKIFLQDGSNPVLIRIPGITLTAQTDNVIINFSPAIRLAAGTIISLVNSSGAANINSFASVWGYTETSQ